MPYASVPCKDLKVMSLRDHGMDDLIHLQWLLRLACELANDGVIDLHPLCFVSRVAFLKQKA